MTQARRAKLKERLHLLTDSMTYEEFEDACKPNCQHCQRGRQVCPDCKGREFNGSKSCAQCGATGEIRCPVCGGDYHNNPLSPSLLKRIVQLELDLLPADESVGKRSARMPPARSQMAWSKAVQQGDLDPLPPLSLETLTEFDLRMDRYRDGKWTR